MNDRKLLEAAAKAAGIVGEYHALGVYQPAEANCYWNPLADDGDALRLAVKLRLDIEFQAPRGVKAHRNELSSGYVSNYCAAENGDDPYAATRRAIVSAAVAMGQS